MSPGLAVLFGSITGQCALKIDSAFFLTTTIHVFVGDLTG